MRRMTNKLSQWGMNWLTRDGPLPEPPLCDFNRLRFELRPCDVLLVEGRSRVAEVIKLITQSPWSHSALYIGRLFDIRNPKLFAPRDFDYSPYFSIIKYPYLGMNDLGLYRRLPWDRETDYVDQQPAPRQNISNTSSSPPAGYIDRTMKLVGLRRKEV